MAGRFSFSTPQQRGPGDPWFRLGQLEVTTTVLVAALAAISFFVYAVSTTALEPLAVIPSKVRGGEVWRVITWPLLNEPTIWALITLAVFWYFGRDLEASLGRTRFLWFLLILTIVGGLVATLFDDVLFGFRFLELGVFVAFAAEHAHARFFFNIPAWIIAAIFIGLDILQLLGQRNFGLLAVELAMVAAALVLSRSMGLASDAPFVPKLPLPKALSGDKRPKAKKPKGKGKLTSVPSGGGSSGFTPLMQAEMDILLDKIGAGGMESLSSAERKRLDELAKRSRGN
jgi:membrane associated rhomboid family serine protease